MKTANDEDRAPAPDGSVPGPSHEGRAQGLGRAILVTNTLATGVMLGILQWSVFFLLQSYLASTAVVYLLGTCVWLLGSLIGMALPGRAEPLFLAGAITCFYLFRFLAASHLYSYAWLPALLPFVAGMGAYAGRFFRCRAGAFSSAKWLFFLENTAFVFGMALTAISLYWAGDVVFRMAPLAAALVVLATATLIWWRGDSWGQV